MDMKTWPAERTERRDPLTGTRVVRLTAGRSHACHLYFTEDGWWDGGRQLLLVADRGRNWNLLSYQVDSGELVQLTDFPAGSDVAVHGAVHHGREVFVCWLGRALVEVDLRRRTMREVWRRPEGWLRGMVGMDADGRRVWTAMTQGEARQDKAYAGYGELFNQRPLSRVVCVDLEHGTAETVHEERAWITHVNPSPVRPGVLTFCHEGPWHLVQRIWVMDGRGAPRPVRAMDGQWAVGHEFWCADGETVGYHARRVGDDSRHLIGFRRAADDVVVAEGEIDAPTQHAHGNSAERVVLDSVRSRGDWLLLTERRGSGWSDTRILCAHDTSRHHHHSHAHPRFSPDGRWVVFTSDVMGYSDVWMAEAPAELWGLPLARDGKAARFYWM